MNTLEIVKQTNIAAGLQGDIDTISSPTGIKRTIISFVNSAYNDIQRLRDDWNWMRTEGVFSWNQAKVEIVQPTIYKYLSVYYNQDLLRFVEYDEWILNTPYTGQVFPYVFTIKPETNGIICNTVDNYYTVNYRGIRVPETLTTNTQVPLLPVADHFVIVYKAAKEVALFLGNAEIMNLNSEKYDFAINALMRRHNLPKKIKLRPLV